MRIRTVLLVSILLGAPGCGDSATEPESAEPPVAPITDAGGTVTSADGKVTLTVPAGALTAPTAITITPAALTHPRLVPGTAYTFEPDGLTFAVPARLTIRYDSIPAALADEAAFVWLHRRSGDDWVPMEGVPVDTLNRIIAGDINGFSQYGGATSTLAADVLQVGLQLSAMLTNAIASNAIALANSVAALLQKRNDPTFKAFAEPILEAAYATSCSAYTTALGIARDAPITDYGQFTSLLAPAYYWAGVMQELGQDVSCAGSVSLLAAMQDRKFQQFTDFYVTRLIPAAIGSNFDDLLAEVNFVFALRKDAHDLGLDAIDSRLEADAQRPLLNAMRAAAYDACRGDGRHEYLGALIGAAAGADFTPEEIWDDLQFCATRIDWRVAAAGGAQSDNGSLGGIGPGLSTRQMSTTGFAAGSVTLSGDTRAFQCPGGSLESDELVITLDGTEVKRLTASGGSFFPSPVRLDAAAMLSAAGIDPQKNAMVPLVVSRESAGCGLYTRTTDPYPLATLELGYPPPFGYFTDFSSGAGPEWSNPQSTTAPSGEEHLGMFSSASTTLTLGNVPVHTEVIVEFDFYAIRSLDGSDSQFGPDIIEFSIDGALIKRTTFSNVYNPALSQAYPGDYPAAQNAAGTGAVSLGSLGYEQTAGQYTDAVYHIVFTETHTAGTIVFKVAGGGMDQWEGWGLDNVRVTVR